ncbi:MAG: RecX family transcriptional regulator [Tannerella sp.]|jgi:regulatory protein|nr:RecX family transcriptional regulator [Tannerella sp.]
MRQVDEFKLLHSAAAYCSVCERCVSEVKRKIVAKGATREMEDHIIEHLLKEGFIDEVRFCRSFVNDKFRFNRWGRIRIRYELQRKNIPDGLVAAALDGIDEDAYCCVLSDMLKDKRHTVKGDSEQDVFNRLYRFATGRGFEASLVIQCIKSLLKGDYDTDALE